MAPWAFDKIDSVNGLFPQGTRPLHEPIQSYQSADWDRVTHSYVSKIIVIGSDNGLSPGRRQAIIWTNAEILVLRPLEINFGEILIEVNRFLFKKMNLKMSSAKWGQSNFRFTHTHKINRPRTHFTNDFSITIQIRRKFHFAVFPILVITSWQNLRMPRQHSYRALCKILLRSFFF